MNLTSKYQTLQPETDGRKLVPYMKPEEPEELFPAKDNRKKENGDRKKGIQGASANGSGENKPK